MPRVARVQKGVPEGGQFATNGRCESEVSLGDSVSFDGEWWTSDRFSTDSVWDSESGLRMLRELQAERTSSNGLDDRLEWLRTLPRIEGSVTHNPDTKVGFELEVVSLTSEKSRIADEIQSLEPGNPLYCWNAVEDESLEDTKTLECSCRYGSCEECDFSDEAATTGEFITPPLPDSKEGWEALRRGLEVIIKNGGKVNYSCGGHINVDAVSLGFCTDRVAPYNEINNEMHASLDTLLRLSTNPLSENGEHREHAFYTKAASMSLIPNPPESSWGYRSVSEATDLMPKFTAINVENATLSNEQARVEFRIFDGVGEESGFDIIGTSEAASMYTSVLQARFSVAHGMMAAASRRANVDGYMYEPMEREYAGTMARDYDYADDTYEDRILRHVDRWCKTDEAKEQVVRLFLASRPQAISQLKR